MKALITGITGQDGAYLARHLLNKGYEVVGARRHNASGSNWRLQELGIEDAVEFVEFDLLDSGSVERVIRAAEPDHVYNLAAQTFVASSFQVPTFTVEANALGPLRILEAIRQYVPDARFYQASTSEMYGGVQEPQSEETPFTPRSPYGIAKLAAHWATINYRESYDIHASAGILFNHESPLRGADFVTRKIAAGVPAFLAGRRPVVLGNLDAQRDWGYAPEYVEGMHRMLCQDEPEDYVLATGVTSTVRDFVDLCFRSQGVQIEWQGEGVEERGLVEGRVAVRVDAAFFRPSEVWTLRGDASKAKRLLGWEARTAVADLAGIMTSREVQRADGVRLEVA